ncbi:MAG: ammonium transporter [Elusimicrobia bacterium]|nr:ammonium transporter [Elusimicrobiota bacterium]
MHHARRFVPVFLILALSAAAVLRPTAARAEKGAGSLPAAGSVAALLPAVAHAADPVGARTGTSADVDAAVPGRVTLLDLANQSGHNKVALNMMWTLLTGFLVMFMSAGFALVETGFTRAKNACHTIAMNLLVYPVAAIAFYAVGFGLMFGGVGALGTLGGYAGLNHEVGVTLFGKTFGLFGRGAFALTGTGADVSVFALFLFQLVFMDAAVTIPTGAMAERWKFLSFFLYGWFVAGLIYPLYGNWVWGGGWLSALGANFGLGHGHVDFAGSSVVHMCGGVMALTGAWLLGPRHGKYNQDGSPNVIPGHNIPMAVLGTFVLAFGWFGFNPGSTLAGGDMRIALVAVNTLLASATGAVAATLWMWTVRGGKPDPGMMCNGMLAGLVAITAPCAYVGTGAACLIGLIAGVLVVEAAFFVERRLMIDDPVGAIAVHGVNGAWGCLALGLFADGSYGDGLNGVAGGVRGLFYGDGGQLAAQCVGVAANFVFVGLASLALYKILDLTVGNRVDRETEIKGLDIPELGVEAYPGFDTWLTEFGLVPTIGETVEPAPGPTHKRKGASA